METKLAKTLAAAVHSLAAHTGIDEARFLTGLERAFDADLPFLEKVAMMDAVFDDEPKADVFREVCFDLLLVNFFTGDVKKLEADYLDSPEWEAIEEQTIDRGTEVLNLLLYLNECADEDIEPSLADYLNEFLLVDEDEFQDEHHIYEDVIANQHLAEAAYPEIAAAVRQVPDESELKELFYPLMSFFSEPNPSEDQLESYLRSSESKAFDHSVYVMLRTFNL